MGQLHDALEASGYRGHDLEMFLVRTVFCLFADDTGIFEPRDIFLDLLETRTREDGSDLGAWLSQLFQVLDTPVDQRQATLDEDLAQFPYVNGTLFDGPLRIPSFDAAMRAALIDACRFDWVAISPAIFGALFQSVMEPAERRAQGAHYTTEKNIFKGDRATVPRRPESGVPSAPGRAKTVTGEPSWKAFHVRLGEMTFFDPACGCGNFLIIAYRELRELEIDLIRELRRGRSGEVQQVLDTAALSRITVGQFYGIELGEFPARIAETALWMMDHIMNNRLSLAFGQSYVRIPLEGSPPIRNTDALEVDWADFLPPEKCSFVFGNPPFGGAKFQSEEQRIQVRRIAALGKSWRDTRLCNGMVYQSWKIHPKGIGADRLRRHQFDHTGRAGGATLADPFRALQDGDCLRAPYVRLGLGRAWQGPRARPSLSDSTSGIARGWTNVCSAIPTSTANRKKPCMPRSRPICSTPAGSPIRI